MVSDKCTVLIDRKLPERWATLREFIGFRAQMNAKPMKAQAADMDLAPSTLSRKMNPVEGDTQRLNLDDLERWLESTGDVEAVLQYLVSKYLVDNDAARDALISQATKMMADLGRVLEQLGAGQ